MKFRSVPMLDDGRRPQGAQTNIEDAVTLKMQDARRDLLSFARVYLTRRNNCASDERWTEFDIIAKALILKWA
jgi:hypothetical protein